MDIGCPECGKNMEIDGEDLPSHACDDTEYNCQHCDHEFNIGWYAVVEIR